MVDLSPGSQERRKGVYWLISSYLAFLGAKCGGGGGGGEGGGGRGGGGGGEREEGKEEEEEEKNGGMKVTSAPIFCSPPDSGF